MLIEREMRLANTIRISMAKQEQYGRFYDNCRIELDRLDGKTSKVYEEAWEIIKMKGGG